MVHVPAKFKQEACRPDSSAIYNLGFLDTENLPKVTHLASRNSYLVIIWPNSYLVKSWPKSKLGKVGIGLNIAQNHSSSL